MSFAVRLTAAALNDIDRLFEHRLEHARTVEDLALADRARDVIVAALNDLSHSPFICRKAGTSPFLRELVIAFGHTGYVAQFEIDDAKTLTVLAVRHQLEDDYH